MTTIMIACSEAHLRHGPGAKISISGERVEVILIFLLDDGPDCAAAADGAFPRAGTEVGELTAEVGQLALSLRMPAVEIGVGLGQVLVLVFELFQLMLKVLDVLFFAFPECPL